MIALLHRSWHRTFWAIALLLAMTGALFVGFEPTLARDIWFRLFSYVTSHWRNAVLGPGGRMLLMISGLMVMELFFLDWERTTICSVFFRRSNSAKADAAWAMLYFAHLTFFVETALTLGAAYGLSQLAGTAFAYVGWQRAQLPGHGLLTFAIAFAAFYLLSTFGSYWLHRLQHWRYFWNLHRYHHAATELNVLTGFRNNPAESLVNAVSVPLPLAFVGADNLLIVGWVLLYQTISTLQHSELPWDFGWIGRWVIVSPRMHQVHHSIDAEHRDLNFSVCPLWDHLFGTWYAGPNRPSAYGIPDPAHVERPMTQWLIDVWAFYCDAAVWLLGIVRLPPPSKAMR
jgi:sterol desaturase/sphingolipid hydroxylase (fatty acid hydroxylase superfamily)